MSNKRARSAGQRRKIVDETSYLTGRRRGAVLKEEVWSDGSKIVKCSLAYINPKICGVDDGRVLGYDNSHDRHHRHFMGEIEPFEFSRYEELLSRFHREVEALWRREDGTDH